MLSYTYMAELSTEGLTSAASQYRNEAIAAAHELKKLAAERCDIDNSPDGAKYLHTVTVLNNVAYIFRGLVCGIQKSQVISRRIWGLLQEHLQAYEQANAVAYKHVIELFEDPDADIVNNPEFKRHLDLLTSFHNLFSIMTAALEENTHEKQDEELDDMGYDIFKREVDKVIQQGQAQDDAAADDAAAGDMPPSYDDAVSPPQGGPQITPQDEPQAPPSSGWAFSSLSKSFKAMAAGILPGPSPLATALCHASADGNISQIEGLLRQAAPINGRDADGFTPLHRAVAANQVEAAELLLSYGADEKAGKLPMLFVAAIGGNEAMIQMLLKRGARANQKSITGYPYFLDVVAAGSIVGANYLLQNQANANAKSLDGTPAIVQAVRKGNLEMVALLLDHGASVNATSIDGTPVLLLAEEFQEIRRLLLLRGANPNSQTITGMPALVDAISKRKVDWAKELLCAGASGKCSDITGQPAIIMVIRDMALSLNDKEQLVEHLLQRGADANSKDAFIGYPALRHAEEKDSLRAVASLLRHGAVLGDKAQTGRLFLTFVVNKQADLVRLMLDRGADPNMMSPQGRTILSVAEETQHFETIQLLKQYGAGGGAAGNVHGGRAESSHNRHHPETGDAPPPTYDRVMKGG